MPDVEWWVEEVVRIAAGEDWAQPLDGASRRYLLRRGLDGLLAAARREWQAAREAAPREPPGTAVLASLTRLFAAAEPPRERWRDWIECAEEAERRAAPRPRARVSRTSIFARDGWACRTCGASADLTVDHIVPRAKGGGEAPDNLQTLCRSCNARKRDRVADPRP